MRDRYNIESNSIWKNTTHQMTWGELCDDLNILSELVDEADDIIMSQCTEYYQRRWVNIKENVEKKRVW